MLRAFLKDSAVYAIPAFASRGLSLFLIPLYTRVLNPADYGSLDLLLAFASIINITIALQVSQGVARFYSDSPNSETKIAYASSAFWFTVTCYMVFAVAAFLLTKPLADTIMGQSGRETAFQIGIAYVFVNGLFYLIQNQFRWELRSREYAVVSLTMSFVTAGVSVWLTYRLLWGLNGLLIGMVTGCLTGVLLGLWWLRSSFRFRFDVTRLREMLAFSTPLVFSGMALWVSLYIDRLMINYFLSINDLGLYGIGYRVASIVGLMMVGVQGALTPLVYAHYREVDTPLQMARIFRLFLTFALLLFLALSLFATDILRLMTTESFYGGSVVVVYLVPAILLSQMYIFAPGISIAKKTHLIVWINVCGGVLNAVLSFVMIPRLGIVGAGLATLLSCAIIFMAHMVISQRLYRIPHNWWQIGAAVALAALLTVSAPSLALNDAARWSLNVAVLVLFLAASFALGLVRATEIRKGWVFLKAQWRSNFVT